MELRELIEDDSFKAYIMFPKSILSIQQYGTEWHFKENRQLMSQTKETGPGLFSG